MAHRAPVVLKASTKSNICAYMIPTSKNARPFIGMIEFLSRSRIAHAISYICTPYASHQREFWATAEIDCEVSLTVIRGKIAGQEVIVSASRIRRLCQFGDHPEDPVTLDKYLVRECFMRIKYDGNVAEGVLNKANLCPQYKYLGHVLLHCLGSRRGGFDDMRETIQSAFVALVLNIPFNFSEMVFTHLKENISLKGDNAYLMYPRFLQMIIDDQLPLLPRSDIDMIRLEHMTDVTLNRVQTYRGRPTKPPHKRLIGHLANSDFVAPANRNWRHDNSDSDREDIVVPPADDQDDDDQDGQGGGGNAPNVPSNTATTPTVTAIDSSLPTNPEDVNLDTVLFTNSEETEDEFEISQQGARLVATKRKRGADQGSSRVDDDDVRDADFVPDCPQVSAAPSSQSTPVKKGRMKRMAKRQKFKLVRRTESTSATTATATRSEAPMSTSMPQTQTVPLIPPPIYTTAHTSQPATTRAESSTSLPTISLNDQIITLNSLVLQLLAQNQEQSKRLDLQGSQISQLTLQNTEQAQAITSLSNRCNDQQPSFSLLQTRINSYLESRRDTTPRIEGARNDGDDDDDDDEDDDDDDGDDDDDDDDDSDDDEDNNDDDKDDGANAGAASSAAKTAEAEARTKQKSDKSEGPSSDKPKDTEVLDVMPLKQQPIKLTYVLDMQGIIQHSVIYDKEEGEIVHCLSKEQIAELFQMNPDEVITEEASVSTTDYPSSDELEDVDEVEVEDITDQEYPKYTSVDGDDLPSFVDLFTQQSDEEVNRIIDNKGDEAGPSTIDIDELNERKSQWMEYMAELKKNSKPSPPTKYTKVYRLKGHKSDGRIISWAYFNDLSCYAIKREKGIQYFRYPHDFKTLPAFEVNQLARLKLLYSESSGLSEWFERQLQYEYRKKWVNFKPQMPARYIHKEKVHPVTKKPLIVLKWKPPTIMKKIPLRKMIQDFSDQFKWWYYDGRTGEAVIVLCKEGSWETIRVFDPLWLTNLSEQDVTTLYKCQPFFEVADIDQALQYVKVIRICFAFDIHAGVNWKTRTKEMLKTN
ncbi:hypothetical protein L1987_73900 [Smallanthus sonchifolius]|uniref:Uncharacterized protein n=1 Tax=Smallanthus sonchifolius TaxID=185202 RepID=A0ACB9A2C7_9ASTR|nr:hypothetical protein L1987_73900 [Smallanthus sonchifolius]